MPHPAMTEVEPVRNVAGLRNRLGKPWNEPVILVPLETMRKQDMKAAMITWFMRRADDPTPHTPWNRPVRHHSRATMASAKARVPSVPPRSRVFSPARRHAL